MITLLPLFVNSVVSICKNVRSTIQVAMLESELNVMEQERDKLEGLVEGMETRMGEVTNTAGLEAMLEAEEREERRAQENIIDLNIKYNKVVSGGCTVLSNWHLFTGH